MKSILKFIVEVIFPIALGVFAWWVGTKISLTNAENLELSFSTTILASFVVLLFKFDALERNIEAARTSIRLLDDFAGSMKDMDPVSRQILSAEFNAFEKLLSESRSGRIEIKTPTKTTFHYAQLFASAAPGSIIKATTRILPSDDFRRLVLDENRKFIQNKGGKIQRIFLLPRDPALAAAWQDYMNQQRTIGVIVSFRFLDSFGGTEHPQDIFVLSEPYLATEATPSANGKEYAHVSLFTKRDHVSAVEQQWNQFTLTAHPCDSDTALCSHFNPPTAPLSPSP